MRALKAKPSPWFKHGIWNTLEHALTRGADTLSTVVLLWALPVEIFSKLALAQAWVAPILILFVAPETVMYRDFAAWTKNNIEWRRRRVAALRRFGALKGLVALLLSAVAAVLFRGESSVSIRFYSLVWAFAIVLGPQVPGADREFLRLSLKLEELNAITLYQKLSLLIGTVTVAFFFPARIDLFAFAASFSVLSTAWLARIQTLRVLGNGPVEAGESDLQIVWKSLRSFSLGNHLVGVIFNWIQTMDLFFLGVLRYPARLVGLYAIGLKLANFSLALPTALSSLFSIWVGRRDDETEGRTRELANLRRYSKWLLAGGLAQALVIVLLAPRLISIVSHGRWGQAEQRMVVGWLKWVLLGTSLTGSTLLFYSWSILRKDLKMVLSRVFLPWIAIALAAYATSALRFGTEGVAVANVVVGAGGLLLFLLFFSRDSKKASL